MQVILKKDIPGVGRMGELVKVKSGYARNFLIPRALVIAANPGNLKVLEHQKRQIEFQKKKVKGESEEVAKKLGGTEIKVTRRFNEAGKMFGSLGGAEIASELATQGYVVDRRDVEIEPIRAPGEYSFRVRLPGDVFVELKLILESQEEKPTKAKSAAKKTKTAAKKKTAKAEEEGEEKAEEKVEAKAKASEEHDEEEDETPAKKATKKKSSSKSKSSASAE